MFKKGTFTAKLLLKLTGGLIDPLIICSQIFQYEMANRTPEDLEKTLPWLMKMKDLYEFLINYEDPSNYKTILMEFAYVLFHHYYPKNGFIKRIDEKKEYFYIILSGSVTALDLKVKEYNMSEEDFLVHLLKLKLLKEESLYKKSLELNKKLIEVKGDFDSFIKNSIRYDYDKMLAKAHKLILKAGILDLEKIEKKIKDMSSYMTATNFDNSIDMNFLKENSNPFGKKYYLIPYYYKIAEYEEGRMFGNLLISSNAIVDNYTLIASDSTDIGYINKAENSGENIFKIINNKMNKLLCDMTSKFYIFQTINSDIFIKKQLASLFTYRTYNKGDIMIHQDSTSAGLFFISKGNFDVYCQHNFDELDKLCLEFQSSLDKFHEYIPNIKKKTLDVDTFLQFMRDPLYNSPEYQQESKQIKTILLDNAKPGDVLGLYDSYNFKTKLNNYSAKCVSDKAVVYQLSREGFSYLCDKVPSIIENILRIVENRITIYCFSVEKSKQDAIKLIKAKVLQNKIKNKKLAISTTINKKVNLPPIQICQTETNKVDEREERHRFHIKNNSSIYTRETDYSANMTESNIGNKEIPNLKRKALRFISTGPMFDSNIHEKNKKSFGLNKNFTLKKSCKDTDFLGDDFEGIKRTLLNDTKRVKFQSTNLLSYND